MKPEQTLQTFGSTIGVVTMKETGHANTFQRTKPRNIILAKINEHGRRQERRGRKKATSPSLRHLEILKATKTSTYEQVGASYGISKQRVGYIAQRWWEYLPVRSLPTREVVKNNCGEQTPRKSENRNHVISFRLTGAEVKLLRSRYSWMKSVDRAARGIVTSVLSIRES